MSVAYASSSVDRFSQAATEALAARALGRTPTTQGGRELYGKSFVEVGREWLALRGRDGNLPPEAVARILLGAEIPYSTPGDFPNLLSNLASKILSQPEAFSAATFKAWCSPLPPVRNFQPTTVNTLGEFGDLPYHGDGRDFEQSKPAEGPVVWFQTDSYGDEFALTSRMIVDDNLGGFTAALQDKQLAHDQTLNRLCCNLLTLNQAMGDGYALFGSNHGNLAGSGAAPNKVALSGARLAMRMQTGIGGRILNLPIDGLLIPPELETTVQELLQTTLQISPPTSAPIANTSEGADVFRGSMTWWVEGLLSANSTTAWYAVSKRRRGVCYCFQEGFEQMVQRSYWNPRNNCRIWQFEGRFGVCAVDHRPLYKNAGA